MVTMHADEAEIETAAAEFRQLGANTVRVVVPWFQIAPSAGATKKPNFNATDPNAYPARNWTTFDNIVRAAAADGITIDFTLSGGAPRWAESKPPASPGADPAFLAWKPNAAAYGQWVKAMGTRYSGHFRPKEQTTALPAVHFWALFNEPNFGQDLGPQAINDSKVLTAPMYYRGLVNQGYNALKATGHARNTIVIGEFAARHIARGGAWGRIIGLTSGGQKLAALLLFITDVHSLGLNTAQGLNFTETFYWDLNDQDRAFAKRFQERMKNHSMPTMVHAGVYSSLIHYFKALEALGGNPHDGAKVVAKMKEMPTDDPLFGKGSIEPNGRAIHPAYLFEVKKPSESKAPWDYYKLVATIPANEAFTPLDKSTCPLLKK